MIVAESPTQIDDDHNRVFLGKQLKTIKEFFEAEGFTVHCAYASKCYHPKEVKPTAKHRKACREAYLEKEIAEVKPKHIIVLGGEALTAVTKQGGISEKRGTPLHDARWDYTVYPTLHQAQAAYSEENRLQMWADLKLFLKWIKYGVQEVSKFDPPVYVASTIRALLNLEKKIAKAGGIVAVDTETMGLTQYDPTTHIRSIQFCWDTKVGGVFVPLVVGDNCYYTDPANKASFWTEESLEDAVKIIRRILLRSKCIWHNGKFDRIWLYMWGLRMFGEPILAPHIHMDTMHVAFTINENRALGLKRLITSELGYPTYDIQNKLTKDLDILIPYSTKDTVACLLLAEKYTETLNQPGMEKVKNLYLKVTRRADKAYTEMELEGWPISYERIHKVVYGDKETQTKGLEEIAKERMDTLVQAVADAGVHNVAPVVFSSPVKLAVLLFETMGLFPNSDDRVARTKTGGLSTSNDALIHLRANPVVKALFEWRAVTKVLSTYARPMLHAAMTRGKLTTSYKLTGTVTGRTASGKEGKGKTASGMNLQNVPPTYGVKSAVIFEPETEYDVEDPWWILELDFSQIELRVAGEMSHDRTLVWAYSNGIDLHTYRAQRILRVTPEEWDALDPKVKKRARTEAKPVNFGFLYGMSWQKFKQFALTNYDIEFTSEESRTFREDFFEAHDGLSLWYARQERQAERLGYVESLSGRRRHLADIRLNPESSKEARRKRQDAIRQAINTPVQGFASDLKQMAIIEIRSILNRDYARIIGEVHDSIVLIVRRSAIREVAEKGLEIMRHPRILDELGIKLTVPIEAEAECGPSWGEKKELNSWPELALAS
jgi:uracil-DNA glycosylase family 4